jgi:hypothetical protein
MTHEFKHPKYYTELRKRNKSDQAISNPRATAGDGSVRPDPGLKPQAASSKLKETSCPDDKIQDPQASSDKLQAPSHKHQASSRKRQAP